MTTLSELNIDGTDRKADHMGAITVTRRMNAVGQAVFTLDNTEGTYDDLISAEHNYVQIRLGGNQFFFGHVSRVENEGRDEKGRWEKLTHVTAADQAEELLFFDDFEKTYNTPGQTLEDILDDLFNHAGLTFYHIIYTPLSCPDVEVGSFEKKEGQSLLTFLQELHRSVDCIFYVDDSGYLRSKSLGTIADSGVTLSRSNLIGSLRFLRQSTDKLYNYIKVYGKNPMFDAWTEHNAASWTSADSTLSDELTEIAPSLACGKAAIKVTKVGSPAVVSAYLDFTSGLFNYTGLDLSKGTIGCWVLSHGGDANPSYRLSLQDVDDHIITYYGSYTKVYAGFWGWISAPLAKDIKAAGGVDQWIPDGGIDHFHWEDVKMVAVGTDGDPDYFVFDGLTLPIPAVAIATAAPFGTAKHKRPLVLSRPDLRSQLSLQKAADTLLAQHQDPAVQSITGVFAGNTSLRYAGLKFLGNFDMDISNLDFYASQVVHTIAPYGDAGKGWDHAMSVEGVYVDARAYDLWRLGPQSFGYSIPGIGLREK